MYRFSYVKGIAGKAMEVDKDLFHQIINDKRVTSICAQISALLSSPQGADEDTINEISKLKRRLPAFCWHAWFDEGKRKNDQAHPSGLIMIDVDHVDDPLDLYIEVEERAQQLGLVAAHVTPSTKGLRLVFPVPQSAQGDLEKAQAQIAAALHLSNVDACTKDLARMSFCVPQGYFIFVDEERLFNPDSESIRDLPSVEQGTALPSPRHGLTSSQSSEGLVRPLIDATNDTESDTSQKSIRGSDPLIDATSSTESDTSQKSIRGSDPLIDDEAQPESAENETATAQKGGQGESPFPTDYQGIPYPMIVGALEEQLGGTPAHGSRNNFIFSMAAYLRYVCNDDAEWIAHVLPTYGEAQGKWRRTVESACQRAQYRQMPTIVQRAIEMARQRQQQALETTNEEARNLPPAMPDKLPRLIAHLVKNVPEVCRPSVANAVFPALAAHLHGVKFWLVDGTQKEATFMCVNMAKQSSGKSAVNKPIEYITADIVERDELSRKREQEWKDATSTKGANKEKPKRPDDLCVQVLVSDMTNAALVQRTKDAGDHYLYTNLEELELLKQLQTNGTKDVGKIICLCFDNGKYGQERVGTQSVTARVDLRWNWNASSTIQKGIDFFRGRLVDGTVSRLNFCTIIPDKTKPFVYGRYDDAYAEKLKPHITNLNLANGVIECKQALDLARKMEEYCNEQEALTSETVYQEMAFRAVTIAYLKAMVLYIANDMTWGKDIAEFAMWSLRYDLWCKMHFFGELLNEQQAKENIKNQRGPRNLLDLLPNAFTQQQAADVRRQQGMKEGAPTMIAKWVYRGYVEQDPLTDLYVKTDKYLNRQSK